MNLLNIPHALANRENITLIFAYKKYCGYLEATETLGRMLAAGTWPGKKPSETSLIELFISKSMWHSHYRPSFSKVSRHGDLQQWLEDKDNKPTALSVWGIQKSSYTFKDLKTFLDNGGILVDEKKKGKHKATEEPRKHKKESSDKKSVREKT